MRISRAQNERTLLLPRPESPPARRTLHRRRTLCRRLNRPSRIRGRALDSNRHPPSRPAHALPPHRPQRRWSPAPRPPDRLRQPEDHAGRKSHATQVVVEVDKAGDTPIGMTPWSANGPGHDVDKAAGGECEKWSSLGRPPSAEECYSAMCTTERMAMTEDLAKHGVIEPGEMTAAFFHGGPDPLLPAMKLLREDHERRSRA